MSAIPRGKELRSEDEWPDPLVGEDDVAIEREEKGARFEGEWADPLVAAGDAAIERLPALRSIFDQMAAEFSQRMAGAGKAPAHFTIEGLTARRVADAEVGGREHKLAMVYGCAELDAKVLFAINRSFVNGLIEVLFGGTFADSDAEARPISRIETRVAGFALDHLAASLESSLARVVNAKFRREAIQTSVDLSVLGRMSAVIVLCKCSLRAFGRLGEALIVLPRSALDPFRAALSRDPATDGVPLDERWAKQLHDSIVQTEVKVSAVMDKKGLTLGDVARFEVGQVLQLDLAPTSLIKLECARRTLFWCNFGQKDGFYTVRIEDFVDESEEFIQDILGG